MENTNFRYYTYVLYKRLHIFRKFTRLNNFCCSNSRKPVKSIQKQQKNEKKILKILYNNIHNLISGNKISNKFQIFIILLVTQQSLLGNSTNSMSVISFLATKCLKCSTVASYKYYFIEKISRTTRHRTLIDPPLESRKFPPYCG